MKKPFSNFDTKTKGQLKKPSIRSLETPIDEDNDTETEFDPTITSFMASQYEYATSAYDDPSSDGDPTICMQMTSTSTQLSSSNPKRKYVPNFDLQCFTKVSSRMSTAGDNTPKKIQQIVHHSHAHRQLRPSKAFLRQHCQAIEKLDMKYFDPYCKATFHVDGGANCGGINDKRLFYFYIDTVSQIEQVGGDHVQSPGWGGILININNNVHLIAPVYYCPMSPRNTLSTTSLIQFCAYNEAIVNTNRFLQITDTRNITSKLSFDVHNDLDHLTLSVVALKPQSNLKQTTVTQVQDTDDRSSQLIASAITHPRRSPRLQLLNKEVTSVPNLSSSNPSTNVIPINIPNLIHNNSTDIESRILSKPMSHHQNFDVTIDGKVITTLPRQVVSHIAAMFVHLHPDANPRCTAIKQMNGVLHNYLGSIDNNLQQIPTEPIINEQYLIPVIANLSRSFSRTSSPTHDWLRLHFGLSHASPTVMDTMIKKEILADIPSSLKTKHSFKCSCYICMATKTNKLPRGKSVDKSHLKPFERLHIDFSFFWRDVY